MIEIFAYKESDCSMHV